MIKSLEDLMTKWSLRTLSYNAAKLKYTAQFDNVDELKFDRMLNRGAIDNPVILLDLDEYDRETEELVALWKERNEAKPTQVE